MDLMTGMAAIGQALDAAKKLRDLEKDFDAATFKIEISNLMLALADAKSALAEARIELAEVRQRLAELDAELARLQSAASSKVQTVAYQGFEFGIRDGRSMGLPFCPSCIANSGKQVQIVRLVDSFHQCPVCKAMYGDPPTALPASLIP